MLQHFQTRDGIEMARQLACDLLDVNVDDVAGGIALYATFILGLHARWFGVPVLGVSL